MGLMKTIRSFGISKFTDMPEHKLRRHPFLVRSYLDPFICDESEERSAREVSDSSDGEKDQIETATQQTSLLVQFDKRVIIVLGGQVMAVLAYFSVQKYIRFKRIGGD